MTQTTERDHGTGPVRWYRRARRSIAWYWPWASAALAVAGLISTATLWVTGS